MADEKDTTEAPDAAEDAQEAADAPDAAEDAQEAADAQDVAEDEQDPAADEATESDEASEATDSDSDSDVDEDEIGVVTLDGAILEEEEPEALTPDSDAKAEPYHAIMLLDEKGGNTNGQLWTFGGRIMLFAKADDAEKILAAVESAENHWALRGVTAVHLDALRGISAHSDIPLFVIEGFTPEGKVEAIPLDLHEATVRAGAPPPLPPKKG